MCFSQPIRLSWFEAAALCQVNCNDDMKGDQGNTGTELISAIRSCSQFVHFLAAFAVSDLKLLLQDDLQCLFL